MGHIRIVGSRQLAALLAILVWAPIALAWAQTARGQDVPYPREHHPWGHFPVGSWKYVRTTSETLDEKSQVTQVNTTETRTTLLLADDASYSLRSDVTVEVAGRRIAMTPTTLKHGYYGVPVGRPLAVKQLGEAPVTIDGRAIQCEVRQVAIELEGGKLTSKLHYTSLVAPFVLRRESTLEGAADEKRNSTLVEVIALDLPTQVRDELKNAMYVKTTSKLPQTTKVTLEVHCDDVPGGVVAHWASETDATGRIVRRSTLELVDHGLPVVMGRTVFPMPRNPRRAAKAARRMDGR